MYLVNSHGNKTLNSPALSDTLVCMLVGRQLFALELAVWSSWSLMGRLEGFVF
ncbi:hypothetical protein HanPI659440_Chr01g0018891 [Helianthus annuus]|nr:hypothetical protein HanPI659440_Chr01g0018891 [Helianthus annuus]